MNNKNKKILVVDDAPEIGRAVSQALKNAGYEADAVLTGKEGIEKIKNNKYELILLDLVMPGKSGFEVLKELRISGLETPIIVYSNLRQDFTRDEALKMGASDYFEKAVTPLNDLIEHAKRFLNP